MTCILLLVLAVDRQHLCGESMSRSPPTIHLDNTYYWLLEKILSRNFAIHLLGKLGLWIHVNRYVPCNGLL